MNREEPRLCSRVVTLRPSRATPLLAFLSDVVETVICISRDGQISTHNRSTYSPRDPAFRRYPARHARQFESHIAITPHRPIFPGSRNHWICADLTRFHLVIRPAPLPLLLAARDPTQPQDLLPRTHWPEAEPEVESFRFSNGCSRPVTPPDVPAPGRGQSPARDLQLPTRGSAL